MKKEYIINFYRFTSLDDNTLATVVADDLEKAEEKARKKVENGKEREIRDIWEIKDSERIRLF